MRAAYVLLALVSSAAPRAADTPPEPGVWWEQTVEMQSAGFQLPPQTMKVCLPRKQEWTRPPQQEQGPQKCKMTDVNRSGNRMTWKMACEGGTSGEGEMTWTDASYEGKSVMRMQGGEMRMSMKGRKVGGDCDANAEAARMQHPAGAPRPPAKGRAP
jgi:hypothetical protein